jgi:hypothetical protein
MESQKRDDIDRALRKVVGLIISKVHAKGVRVEKTFPGDLKKRINGEKKKELGPVESCSIDQLDKHWIWIKHLEAKVLSGKFPSWIM